MIKLGDYWIDPARVVALREDTSGAGDHIGVVIWLDGRNEPLYLSTMVDAVLTAIERKWD